ncbi:MAG: NAD(P)-dependent oxidoreductase [Bacteroidales bacterium]|nr:NAD(P)-dependent oxidoreductase [Bacteroidales bacterium]
MLIKNKKPTILLTGASGFIGKYFLDLIKEDYSVIAIARRSSTEAGVPFHPNIRWIQWNIANKVSYNEVMGYIIGRGGADYLVHLAGYYDYEYDENPEYRKTNVDGTRNVLELARYIDVKHFIFASSLAACRFPPRGKVINEQSDADASFAYARSKKAGEEYCREYSRYFTCSAVRFAAVFSDWCEFSPLYQFLQTWLSGRWDARILGGRGESAISYIHIHDLCRLLLRLIRTTSQLPEFGTYIASPDGSTSHRELFHVAIRDYFGRQVAPVFLPKIMAYPGILVKRLLGRMRLSSRSFEKFWMIRYIDQKLHVDSSYTRTVLEWEPLPRYHILRRMIFLLDKMKSHPHEWDLKNEAITRKDAFRPNLMIYEHLIISQDALLKAIHANLTDPANRGVYPHYQELSEKDLQVALSTMYMLLLASVRSGDRGLMRNYIEDIALTRFTMGFEAREMIDAVAVFGRIINEELEKLPGLASLRQHIYDYVGLTIQLALDEIEDVFDKLARKLPHERLSLILSLKDEMERREEIRQLSAIYQEYDSLKKVKAESIPGEDIRK